MKIFKLLFRLLIVLIGLMVLVFLFVQLFDWNLAKPFINRTVSDSTGRIFSIGGNLSVKFLPGMEAAPGWQRIVPRLQISADDINISNPAWSHVGAQMASAAHLTVTIRPLPLLGKHLILTEVSVSNPAIALERRVDGLNSWSMKDNGPSTWNIAIQRFEFTDGNVRYLDNGIALDLRLAASSIATGPKNEPGEDKNRPAPPQFGIALSLSGTYRNAPVTGSGMAGALLSLENAATVYPVKAHAQLGQNTVDIEGTLTDPGSPSGIDLQLMLGGASMADLYPLTGVLLPETPSYQTKGRLIGKKAGQAWDWTYEKFTGRVGASDLAGTLQFLPNRPRPLLRGEVSSTQLQLKDLGPTIGAGSNAEKIANGKTPDQPNGKVLPVEEFNTAHWDALDADVQFNGKRLVRTDDIPLENISAQIHLKDKVLSLTPLNFGMAGGNITSNITLDGRGKIIDTQIKMAARHLKIRELFPKLTSMQASLGEVNGDAALTGHGNSVARMLATSEGEFAANASEGSISKYILELSGLNVANAVFAKIFGDKQIHMNCFASDFSVKQGDAKVGRFVIDTDDAVIDVDGDIDMAQEKLNLDIHPKTKGLRLFSLRTPLYAKGTFSDPDIGPYKGPLILKAGAAAALVAVAPLAAVLPLVNPGTVPVVDCSALLAESKQVRAAPKSDPTAAPAKPVTENQIQKIRQTK